MSLHHQAPASESSSYPALPGAPLFIPQDPIQTNKRPWMTPVTTGPTLQHFIVFSLCGTSADKACASASSGKPSPAQHSAWHTGAFKNGLDQRHHPLLSSYGHYNPHNFKPQLTDEPTETGSEMTSQGHQTVSAGAGSWGLGAVDSGPLQPAFHSDILGRKM